MTKNLNNHLPSEIGIPIFSIFSINSIFSLNPFPITIQLHSFFFLLIYLNNNFCSKLSKTDGEMHILNSGRLVGLSLRDINYLCQQKIHIHSYGSNSPLVHCAQQANPTYFHVHGYCSPKDWVTISLSTLAYIYLV